MTYVIVNVTPSQIEKTTTEVSGFLTRQGIKAQVIAISAPDATERVVVEGAGDLNAAIAHDVERFVFDGVTHETGIETAAGVLGAFAMLDDDEIALLTSASRLVAGLMTNAIPHRIGPNCVMGEEDGQWVVLFADAFDGDGKRIVAGDYYFRTSGPHGVAVRTGATDDIIEALLRLGFGRAA
jgi:hypothetical protein